MDVLKPELVWIEGRCYRINEPSANLSNFEEHDLYESEMIHQDLEDVGDDDDLEIISLDNGRFQITFHVPQHYLGSVIGKKAFTKKKIESDTRTEIRIPKQGQDGGVSILGRSSTSVKTAWRRVNMIVTAARFKQRPTHFISIPMNSPDIVAGFNKFKEEILQEKCDQGLDEQMFIAAEKLHLTICVLVLMDNEERRSAAKLLTDAREKIVLPSLRSQELRVCVRGVSYMNDDPRAVHVLYGVVHDADPPAGRLQKLTDDIYTYFVNSGFSKREFDRSSVKLHMTLINSRYANKETDDVRNRSTRKSFDASRILEKYADYTFGEQALTEMHLSQLHTVRPDGYYQSTCIISCTEAGLFA